MTVVKCVDALARLFPSDELTLYRLYAKDPNFHSLCDDWRDAAKACEWLGIKQVVPMHYGTMPALTGTPDMLRKHLPSTIEVLELQPGETSE